MQSLDALSNSSEIATLLQKSRSIAVIGLSPKENRPSNMVGRYLLEAGFTIYPVNPGQDEILGQQCFPDIVSIPHRIDVVNIFRRSEDIYPIVEKVLELENLPRAIWMQQGIVNKQAEKLAKGKGIFVVMDRCIKVDHMNML